MRLVWGLIVALVVSGAPSRAGAQDTDARLKALETQLQQALKALAEQQRLTQQAQKQIDELRRQVQQTRTVRRGGAPAEAPTALALSRPVSE